MQLCSAYFISPEKGHLPPVAAPLPPFVIASVAAVGNAAMAAAVGAGVAKAGGDGDMDPFRVVAKAGTGTGADATGTGSGITAGCGAAGGGEEDGGTRFFSTMFSPLVVWMVAPALCSTVCKVHAQARMCTKKVGG